MSEKMIAESKSNLLIGCNVKSELNLLLRQRLINFDFVILFSKFR